MANYQRPDVIVLILDPATIPVAQLQRPGLSAAIEAPHDVEGVAFAEEDYSDNYNPLPGLMRVNPKMDPKKYPERQISVRAATQKYICTRDQPGKFYNLSSDPGETHNLIDGDAVAEQPLLKELHQTLEMWRCGLEYFPPKPADNVAKVDAVTLERLRSLGYIE